MPFNSEPVNKARHRDRLGVLIGERRVGRIIKQVDDTGGANDTHPLRDPVPGTDTKRGIAVIFTLFSSEYFRDTESTPQDLRAALRAGGGNTLKAILNRAVERGEIPGETLSPAVEDLLDVLFRHHALMTFSPPPAALGKAWVDTVFLPLVRHQPERGR